MVMVRSDHRRLGIGRRLLELAEQYLHSRGAKVVYGGGIRPLNPFYLGLYGGSELPGVLESDVEAQQLYQAGGYRTSSQTAILHRQLASFRPLVDRQQIRIRRRSSVEVVEDPPSRSWWEACTFGSFDRTRFNLRLPDFEQPVATATTWSMEPLATSWGVRAVGLIDVEVAEAHRHSGLMTFLLGDAFRHLQTQSVALVEVQTMQENSVAQQMYAKLGFRQIDAGAVFRKE